jgi:hypothetical protein
MNRNARILCFLPLTLVTWIGCSSGPTAQQTKKAAAAPDKIQGKAQVLRESSGATDSALNAGGHSVYIWQGTRRIRLFLRTPVEVTHGSQYVVEGVYAQKTIDDIGDPDQGKNGYPLQSSCTRVVTTAWTNLAFDEIDADASLVCATVKRYPARPLFLVTRIREATPEEGSAASSDSKQEAANDNAKEVPVPAEKERAAMVEGPTVQPAPLWQPAGDTVHCKVVIGTDGKISDLESGSQLCEAVPWSQFSYKPLVQGGKPVKVSTEVEVRFEPHK